MLFQGLITLARLARRYGPNLEKAKQFIDRNQINEATHCRKLPAKSGDYSRKARVRKSEELDINQSSSRSWNLLGGATLEHSVSVKMQLEISCHIFWGTV